MIKREKKRGGRERRKERGGKGRTPTTRSRYEDSEAKLEPKEQEVST
jgi:hypothetical protein